MKKESINQEVGLMYRGESVCSQPKEDVPYITIEARLRKVVDSNSWNLMRLESIINRLTDIPEGIPADSSINKSRMLDGLTNTIDYQANRLQFLCNILDELV